MINIKRSLKKILISKEIEKYLNIAKGLNRNDRIGALSRSWGYVFTNLLKGAYYEFGVYQGESLINSWQAYLEFKRWAASQINSGEAWRRNAIGDYDCYKHDFYGFDTFGGMPDNDEGSISFGKGTYFSLFEEVKTKCRKINMRFNLFKGTFSDLKEEDIKCLQPAAIVNIDSDLYCSARDALEKIKGKLQQGTILLMDDYNCFSSNNNEGERRALKEFCIKNPQYEFEPWIAYQYAGRAFICHIL
jgi:hypothetical protein